MAKIRGGRDADRERSARSRQRRKRGTLNVTFARCQASEKACYWLITTRRAVSPRFDRARNVERDDARDLARALSNPGRAVCWSERRRNAFGRRDCCCKPHCLALGNRGRARAPASACVNVRAEAMYSAEQSQVCCYRVAPVLREDVSHYSIFMLAP